MNNEFTLQVNGFRNKKKHYLFSKLFNASIFVLLLSTFSWQCKKDDSMGGTVGICPKVVAISPDSFQANIHLNAIITVTFNEEINPATLNANTFTVNRGLSPSPVAGIITYANKVATFKLPGGDAFNAHDAYYVTVTTGIKDLAGNALPNDFKWVFYTSILPPFTDAAKLAVLGGNSGITNQGLNTVINKGAIATIATANNITGFHDSTTGDVYTETALNVGKVANRIYAGLPTPGSYNSFITAAYALIDATNAYNTIAPTNLTNGIDLQNAGEIGGMTFTQGTYRSLSSGIKVTNGDLTLDAQGNPNAEWIFQTTFDLTIGSATPKNIILLNGALAKNVYWYVGGTATINQVSGGVVNGVILAYNGINISGLANTQQTTLNGRAFCINGYVNMFNTTITAQ